MTLDCLLTEPDAFLELLDKWTGFPKIKSKLVGVTMQKLDRLVKLAKKKLKSHPSPAIQNKTVEFSEPQLAAATPAIVAPPLKVENLPKQLDAKTTPRTPKIPKTPIAIKASNKPKAPKTSKVPSRSKSSKNGSKRKFKPLAKEHH